MAISNLWDVGRAIQDAYYNVANADLEQSNVWEPFEEAIAGLPIYSEMDAPTREATTQKKIQAFRRDAEKLLRNKLLYFLAEQLHTQCPDDGQHQFRKEVDLGIAQKLFRDFYGVELTVE